MSTIAILAICFFMIALIYASVGFGGGSSYLALMVIMGLPQSVIRPSALLCNIVVVVGGTIIFGRAGHIDARKSWPFVLASVPFAFLGGYWKLSDHTFFLLLGITLVFASIALWIQSTGQEVSHQTTKPSDNLALNMGVSSSVGLLSGLVSIGGGIFLAPILHLLKWDTARRISALASVFILANSISGLAGQIANHVTIDWSMEWPLLLAVLIGGQVGSRLGAKWLNALYIRRITAVLILLAAINILWNL